MQDTNTNTNTDTDTNESMDGEYDHATALSHTTQPPTAHQHTYIDLPDDHWHTVRHCGFAMRDMIDGVDGVAFAGHGAGSVVVTQRVLMQSVSKGHQPFDLADWHPRYLRRMMQYEYRSSQGA